MEAWGEAERDRIWLAKPPDPDGAPPTVDTLYIEPDGTGVPMVPWEVEGRKGKQPDGSAKTREAKVGCMFTQTTLNEKGYPVRDPTSTSFVAAIEDANRFGRRLYGESVRRELYHGRRVVALGDGAEWVKNLVQTHFPQAQFIIDLYHARQHVTALCRALFDRDVNGRLTQSVR